MKREITSSDAAISFLNSIERRDLSALLEGASYRLEKGEGWYGEPASVLAILSARVVASALAALPPGDKETVIRAVQHQDAAVQREVQVSADFLTLYSVEGLTVAPRIAVLAEVVAHVHEMVAVATQQKQIDQVDDFYRARRRRLADSLAEFGIDDPNPFHSLWDWYRHWKNHLATWQERRDYVKTMYAPIIEALIGGDLVTVPPRPPTGWERVDRALRKARAGLERAANEEDYQGIGLLCREVLISVAQAVFDPALHLPDDGVVPSKTDVKRMLDAYVTRELPGPSYEAHRRHLRASWDLAVDLQHRRTATFREAALTLEASSSAATLVAILDGRRAAFCDEPPPEVEAGSTR